MDYYGWSAVFHKKIKKMLYFALTFGNNYGIIFNIGK